MFQHDASSSIIKHAFHRVKHIPTQTKNQLLREASKKDSPRRRFAHFVPHPNLCLRLALPVGVRFRLRRHLLSCDPDALAVPSLAVVVAVVELPQVRTQRNERLYDFAEGLGATVLRTRVSRTVIDVNRDPSGASLYPGLATTALCPTTTFDGEPLPAVVPLVEPLDVPLDELPDEPSPYP